jgi:hypothetical protein
MFLTPETAATALRERGLSVAREELPPLPLPSLWRVDGHEMTENQLINYTHRLLES